MPSKRANSKPERKKARVLIVDDHPVLRQGIGQMINGESDLTVCGEADNAGDALVAVEKLQPDLVVVDISLRDTSGLDLIKDIRHRYATLPVLVLSAHSESTYAERALRAGAKGYVMKDSPVECLIEAVRKVLGGEIYTSEKLTSTLLHKVFASGSETASTSLVDLLTDREFEVFQLIGKGLGTRQIAENLHLSVKTIETHRAHIKEKLQLKSAFELIQCAIQWAQQNDAG